MNSLILYIKVIIGSIFSIAAFLLVVGIQQGEILSQHSGYGESIVARTMSVNNKDANMKAVEQLPKTDSEQACAWSYGIAEKYCVVLLDFMKDNSLN